MELMTDAAADTAAQVVAAAEKPVPMLQGAPAAQAPLTTRPAASSLRTAPNKKNASRTAFLSPAAGQQQTAAQAGAQAASQSAAGSEVLAAEVTWKAAFRAASGHSAADQSAAAAAADKKKTAEQPRAVTKERVKRPVEFPEDIGTLLPPEWGGEAAKLDTPKVKGKQPGKNRPPQLSRSGAAATAVQPQPPPRTRPDAAAAVASASKQFEAQQAQ
ncbi:TPA: hypothetical protein ACH3X3_012695 [Trebouxia sp. C0006]